jgi:hypothetical protein
MLYLILVVVVVVLLFKINGKLPPAPPAAA